MELALPILALGGMYIASNQEDSSVSLQHNSKNNNNHVTNSSSIHLNTPTSNKPSPKEGFSNINKMNTLNNNQYNLNTYGDVKTETNKYLNQNDILADNSIQNEFNHNNMVPFNGGKVRGQIYNYSNENVLDNMNGNGSQYIKKVEQAPLFKPEENIQLSHGAPNNNDFYQSRVNTSMVTNNTKPFESIMVGPGLNKGYGSEGNGGFNSGMDSREQWKPLTVDQMRVSTNPKIEYELKNHEGPAMSNIQHVPTSELLGRVEKNRPDTFFNNTSDRWLKTTGNEKGETQRPSQQMGNVKRVNQETQYMGNAICNEGTASYAPTNYKESIRNELGPQPVGISSAINKGDINKEMNTQGYTNYNNNRTTVRDSNNYGNFGGIMGAVIAPIMDIFKPTLKQEIIDNNRIFGDVMSSVPGNYVHTQDDQPGTTIKETTLHSQHFNVNNQKEGMYLNNQMTPDNTQRDTTTCEYSGIAGQNTGFKNYDNVYRQHNNEIKSSTIDNRINQGGTQMFNQHMNINPPKNYTQEYNYRVNAAYNKNTNSPSVENYGNVNLSQKYTNYNCDERMHSDLLSGFKQNPYTHSLSSAV